MHLPMVALAWQHWGRHRWGLFAAGACLAAYAALFNGLPAGTFGPAQGLFNSLLFFVALTYVAAAFAFGFECKLEARESGFPARLFVLPVRTGVLVAWPMLQGVTTVTLLWAAWGLL